MNIRLSDFDWFIRNDEISELFMSDQVEIVELNSGMEATVYKILFRKFHVVLALKLWDKRVPGDVENQFYLLERLMQIELPVSKPYALGRNHNGKYGLLTSYNGAPLPLDSIDTGNMKDLANLLINIHTSNVIPLEKCIPKYDDFVGYFFSLTDEHTDIFNLLQDILRGVTIKNDGLIHGDFNSGNILVHHGEYTVIDWTNAQLGDRRYDFAWAIFLILIYNGEECYQEFCATYIQQIPTKAKDIYMFEMIACLRWIWLSRIAPIPINKDTVNRVKRFMENHRELQDTLHKQDAYWKLYKNISEKEGSDGS